MTENEKLDLILSSLGELKQDVKTLKQDVLGLKHDVETLKQDVSCIKKDTVTLNDKVTDISLHLENVTDKNISILAENHITLIDRMNQNIKASDKNTIYEIQVRILTEKVDKLEKELAALKNKIA